MQTLVFTGGVFSKCATNTLDARCQSPTHQVGIAGGVVLLGAHPHQAVIVEENAQGVAGSNQDVDPQVKLVTLH